MKDAPILEGLFGLAGLALYLIVAQHLMTSYIFNKPEDSWLRIGWTWAKGYRHRSWIAKTGKTYTLPGKPEPNPEMRDGPAPA